MNYICLFASGIIGSLDTTPMTWFEENLLILLSQASTNSHLSTTATFLVDSPYIVHWLLFKPFSTTATFFCPKGPVAIVERFNCISDWVTELGAAWQICLSVQVALNLIKLQIIVSLTSNFCQQ